MEGNSRPDVIIIGGGIIGLMSAYYLSKKGASVTILDKGPKQQASSHANCGLISPSHIMPLNNISLIFKSLGMLFKKDAAFKIKPQADWQFISWLVGFLAKSLPSAIQSGTQARLSLLLSSAGLYKELIEQEKLQCNWSEEGILFVFKTKRAFDEYQKTDNYTKRFDIHAEPISGKALYDKEPALKEDVHGAWFYDIDSWLKPDEIVNAMTDYILSKGGRIEHNTEVVDFEIQSGKITSVVDKNGNKWISDKYLLATGAWSPILSKNLGFRIPIIPGKGYSMTMKSPEICPKVPCIMMEKKVVATPWEGAYRLGSTMELAGYDDGLNEVRLDALKKGAKEYLKEPYSEDIYEKWWGWRPMTYDGLPIIDKSPKQSNLWLACGHSMVGMSMATGTGKLISEILYGEKPHIPSNPYQFQRFRGI